MKSESSEEMGRVFFKEKARKNGEIVKEECFKKIEVCGKGSHIFKIDILNESLMREDWNRF